jgi:hypothetical protein
MVTGNPIDIHFSKNINYNFIKMLKPEYVEKVRKILKDFKTFQEKFNELKDEEFTQKEILIELITDHLQAGKQMKASDVIRYLDNN